MNPPWCGSLDDIEHVVILIRENRSFDHYFGSHFGVTGFADPTAPQLNDGSGLTVFARLPRRLRRGSPLPVPP
jgi:phospholipase C